MHFKIQFFRIYLVIFLYTLHILAERTQQTWNRLVIKMVLYQYDYLHVFGNKRCLEQRLKIKYVAQTFS